MRWLARGSCLVCEIGWFPNQYCTNIGETPNNFTHEARASRERKVLRKSNLEDGKQIDKKIGVLGS